MFTSDKHIKQDVLGNITDYSAVCPKGLKSFYAYVSFTDDSFCLFANIFASNRSGAFSIALNRFLDCSEYIKGITLYERESE